MHSPRRGASLLDYGLIVLLIAVLLAGTITALGGNVGNPFGIVGGAFNGEAGPSAEATATPEATPTPEPTPSAPAPDASFTFAPIAPVVADEVTFSGPADDVDSWAWDFGDGSNSTLQSPTHVYANSGTYTVSLTVGGPGGTDYSVQPISVAPLSYAQTVTALAPSSWWRLSDTTAVTSATYNVPGTNVVVNSGFESTGTWLSIDGTTEKYVSGVAHSGSRSLMFDEASGYNYVHQGISLPPGLYAVTGYVKTQNFVPGSGGARFMNEGSGATMGSGFAIPAGTRDWTLVSYTLNVTSSSWSGNMLLTNSYGGSGGSGDMWIDDVQVRPLRAQDEVAAAHGNYNNAPTRGAASLLGSDSDGAVTFNAAQEQTVSFTSSPVSSSWTTFSVGAWIKTTSDGTILASHSGTAVPERWVLDVTGGKARYFHGGVGLSSTVNVNDGATHFVMATLDASDVTHLYVDGAEVATGTHSFGLTSSLSFSMGGMSYGAAWFNGTIDEPVLFNRALTADEVGELYRAGTN